MQGYDFSPELLALGAEAEAALETFLNTSGPCLLIAGVASDISTED